MRVSQDFAGFGHRSVRDGRRRLWPASDRRRHDRGRSVKTSQFNDRTLGGAMNSVTTQWGPSCRPAPNWKSPPRSPARPLRSASERQQVPHPCTHREAWRMPGRRRPRALTAPLRPVAERGTLIPATPQISTPLLALYLTSTPSPLRPFLRRALRRECWPWHSCLRGRHIRRWAGRSCASEQQR
jgi:hypothetical protein